EQQAEALDREVGLGRLAAAVDQLAQAPTDFLRRIAGVDSGEVADDRGHRRERRGIRVRARLAVQDDDGGADPGRELVGQAGLADARLTNHRDEHRPAARAGQAKALIEHRLFARTAYERDGAAG